MRALASFIATLGLTVSAVAADAITPAEERDARLRAASAWIETQLGHKQVPGLAAAIVHDQEVIWSKGFGHAHQASETPVTPETAFSVCSVSKLFTSTAVMHLVERGRVDLDAPLSDYVDWFSLKTPERVEDEPMTVRAALTHASGMPREGGTPYWVEVDFPDLKTLRQAHADQDRLYTPYTTWQYSNLGMSLLGQVVAEASGRSFDAYVERTIFRPLDLDGMTTDLPVDEIGGRFAMGYGVLNKDGTRNEIGPYTLNAVAPAAGFAASVTDLAKFASWQFRLMETGEREVLRRASLRQMHRVHWADPNDPESPMWGLGYAHWKHNGTAMIGHGGYCPGYRTQFMLRPQDKLAVIAMVNVNDFSPRRVANALYDLASEAVLTAAKDEGKEASQDAPETDFSDFEGIYGAPNLPFDTYVAPATDGLILIDLYTDEPGDDVTSLEHVEGDTFRRRRDEGDLGETVRFERDETGAPVKLWQHGIYLSRME